MADKVTEIEIKTIATGTGAKEAADDLDKVAAKEKDVTKATDASTEAEKKLTDAISAQFDAAEKAIAAKHEAAREAKQAAEEEAQAQEEAKNGAEDHGDKVDGLMGKVAAWGGAVAGVISVYKGLQAASAKAAELGDEGAIKTQEQLGKISKEWQTLKDNIALAAGSGEGFLAKAYEGTQLFLRGLNSIAQPEQASLERRQKMEDITRRQVEVERQLGNQTTARTQAVKDQTAALEENFAALDYGASVQERLLEIEKRRTVAQIPSDLPDAEKAAAELEAEKKKAEALTAIRDELTAKKAAEIEQDIALSKRKLEGEKDLEENQLLPAFYRAKKPEQEAAASQRVEDSLKAQRELEAKIASSQKELEDLKSKRSSEREVETGSQSVSQLEGEKKVQELKAKAAEQEAKERAKQQETARREAEAADKEAARAAEKETKRQEAEARAKAKAEEKKPKQGKSADGIPADDFALGALTNDQKDLNKQLNKSTPFPQKDANLQALAAATAALDDGATLQELASLTAALERFGATLGGLRFNDKIALLERQVSDLAAREKANRK